jgi:hypothetical protein
MLAGRDSICSSTKRLPSGHQLIETSVNMVVVTELHQVSGTLNTHMNYFLELKDGGTDVIAPGTAGTWLRKHNIQEVQIRDIRQAPEKFGLDNTGFQLVSSVPVIDVDNIDSKGYEQTIALLKRVTGATRVVPFNHLVRRNTYKSVLDEAMALSPDDKAQKLGPSMYSHVGRFTLQSQ